MAIDYAALAVSSAALIKSAGTTITITRDSAPDYNPALGTAEGTTKTFTGVAVRSSYNQRDIDGTMILQGDVLLTIAATSTLVPQVGDTATFAGTAYKVVNVNNVSPSGISVIYTVQARV
jgi:hypothetical protein